MLGLACLTVAFICILGVRAEVERRLLDAGHVLDLPEHWLLAGPHEVVVNGARIQIASGHSNLSLHALLDQAQARCREQHAGLVSLAQSAARPPLTKLPGLDDGVLRAESGGEGVVACLELGKETLSLATLRARLVAFARSADLAELGPVRLFRATQQAQGAFFVLARSAGSLALPRMFPARGDAPGADLAFVPRPRDSARVLSAMQVGGEPSIHAYRVQRELDAAWTTELDDLHDAGWQPLHSAAQSAPQHAALMGRDGHTLLVTGQRDGRHSLITLLALDRFAADHPTH